MDILGYFKNQWLKIETYQVLKDLMVDYSGNEKKPYLQCILKWAASTDNQLRSKWWHVKSALDTCNLGKKEEEAMKQTFSVVVGERLAEYNPTNEDEIRFLKNGIDSGRILRKASLIYIYESVLISGWFLYILGGVLLYLNLMEQVGLLDDIKGIVTRNYLWTKYDSFVIWMFLVPIICYLISLLCISYKAKRVIYGS